MERKEEMSRRSILKPFVPFEGVRVAFINHEGTLIEFLQKTA